MGQTNKTIEMLVVWDLDYLDIITERYNHHLENARLDCAKTNERAFDLLTSRHYDVIFYDLGMDRDENYPIAYKIKDLKPGSILIAISLGFSSSSFLLSQQLSPHKIFDGQRDSGSIFGEYYQPLVGLLKRYGIELLVK